jgi:hypothetical protein
MTNRFETTAFIVFGICIWGIQNYFKILKKNVTVIILGSLICLSLFLISNPVLRGLFLNSSSGEFSVLAENYVNESRSVKLFGTFGLSAMAPFTFVDNSTRTLLNAVSSNTSNQFFEVLLVLIAWIPLSVLLIQVTKNLLLPLFQKNLLWRKSAAERIPALLALGIFLAVPTFARTVWFFWYLAPLLAIFVFFTDPLENIERRFKLLIWLATASNTFYFILVVLKLGTLEVGSISLSPSLQIVLGLSLGLIAYKLVKNLLSTPRRSLIPD